MAQSTWGFSRIRIFSTGASCFLNQNHPSSNMKAFVAMFAAVAAAAAEPWGYGLYGAPLVYGIGKSAPCVNAANVPVPCAHLGKREATPRSSSVAMPDSPTPDTELPSPTPSPLQSSPPSRFQ